MEEKTTFYISSFIKLLDCSSVRGFSLADASARLNEEVLAEIEDVTERLELDEIFNAYPNAVLFATQAISIATSFAMGAAAIELGNISNGIAFSQIGLAETMLAKSYYPMERIKVLATRAANLIKQADPEFPLENVMAVIKEFKTKDKVKQ